VRSSTEHRAVLLKNSGIFGLKKFHALTIIAVDHTFRPGESLYRDSGEQAVEPDRREYGGWMWEREGKTMKTSANRFMLCAAAFLVMAGAGTLLAAPPSTTATCAISASVSQIMEWDAAFPAINLASITTQSQQVMGTAATTLYTNGNVDITADNTTASRLTSSGGATLVTEYSLSYSGDGVAATGGSAVSYATYDVFLSTPSLITHVTGSGNVVLTLGVRASNHTGTVAEATSYSSTQTLTATWVP
jgi:hypothetical protein